MRLMEYKEEILLSFVLLAYLVSIYCVKICLSCSIIMSVLIFLFSIYHFWKVSHTTFNKSVLKNMANIIKGDVATILGLLAFVSEFILLNFLFEYVKDFIEENNTIYISKILLSFGGVISTGLLFFTFYQEKIKNYINNKNQVRREPKKVLIFALSLYNKNNSNIDELPSNWKPIKELLEFHKSKLEVAYVLISEEVEKQVEDFERFFNEFVPKIRYIEKINMNDENSIVDALARIVRYIRSNNYEEKDISIYISGGTSLATAILSLFGVNDEIQVEYLIQDRQNNKIEIKTINLRKELLSIFVSD